MNDKEAEAALLALGQHLAWEPSGSRLIAFVDSGEYIVLDYAIENYRWLPLLICIRFRSLRPLFYRYSGSYQAEGARTKVYHFSRRRKSAQAACEHHYATGTWGKFYTITDPLIK